MKLIKAASVYRCVMPDAATLETHLGELAFKELAPSDFSGAGFVAPSATGALTETFEGGYAFAVRYDEKIIPASVTNAEAKKRIAEIEEQQDRRLGRKERNEIREETFVTLKLKALTRSSTVTCFYIPASQLLIVPTASRSMAGIVTGALVKVMGSLKATTIYVSEAKNGLTTRLAAYLDGDASAFDTFSVGRRCKLAGLEGEKFAFDLADDLNSAAKGLREAIWHRGAKVKEIALIADGLTFRLNDDFQIKGVSFLAGEPPPDGYEDAVAEFKHEAAVQVALFASVVNNLCELLDYKPPQDDTASEAGE